VVSRKTDLHIESVPWRIVHGADLSMICTSNKCDRNLECSHQIRTKQLNYLSFFHAANVVSLSFWAIVLINQLLQT